MSRNLIEDLLITLSYLKIAIISTTIILMMLILIDGTNTDTFLSHYKGGYLEINNKIPRMDSPIIAIIDFIWRYFFELLMGSLGLMSLLNRKYGLYFLLLLVSIAFSFSMKTEVVVIIGLEIILKIVYSIKGKYEQSDI